AVREVVHRNELFPAQWHCGEQCQLALRRVRSQPVRPLLQGPQGSGSGHPIDVRFTFLPAPQSGSAGLQGRWSSGARAIPSRGEGVSPPSGERVYVLQERSTEKRGHSNEYRGGFLGGCRAGRVKLSPATRWPPAEHREVGAL